MDKIEMGKRLQRAREARKFSREQVAKRLKISVGAVGHHETGEREPRAATIAEYARLYRTSTDWIISATGRAPDEPTEQREEVIRLFDRMDSRSRSHAVDVLKTFLREKRE